MVPLAHASEDMGMFIYRCKYRFLGSSVYPDEHKRVGRELFASASWSIVEEEAHAIVESVKHLGYLLLGAKLFWLYSKHRTLK